MRRSRVENRLVAAEHGMCIFIYMYMRVLSRIQRAWLHCRPSLDGAERQRREASSISNDSSSSGGGGSCGSAAE